MEKNQNYDVGIYGLWYGHNYGSIITYYALNNVINSMGYSTVMIKNPLGSNVDVSILRRSHPLRFAHKHYEITPLLRISEMEKLNQICDRFLLGSDQMWNYGLSRPYQQSYFFNFVQEEKIKVAYATSFGREKYAAPKEYKIEVKKNLDRFTAISVRDDFSKEICEKEFQLYAEQVIDPVFLCDKNNYIELMGEAERKYKNYIFAYILDPGTEWGKVIENLSKKTGKKIIVIFNEGSDKQEAINRLGIINTSVEFFTDANIYEWLYCFKHADFVITDSFHGICFSTIFHKAFIVLRNNGRGGRRFDCLLDMIGLKAQMVTEVYQVSDAFDKLCSTEIDYQRVDAQIEIHRQKGMRWLENALKGKSQIVRLEKKNSESVSERSDMHKNTVASTQAKLHPDIERARMLVSLLKAYGYSKVVISSGTRDLSLARIIENNSFFEVYLVTDERSAAYFALGLSVKTEQPVVIMCTSGTAVSNYLPGVTEAYYQKVPIIIITGDRYSYYIGQMEPQMIKQYGLFRDVCKLNINLDIEDTQRCKWSNYRKICEALLEVNHHGKGPVHINFPIDIVEHNPPDPVTYFLPKYEKIERVDFYSGQCVWEGYGKQLRMARRIMVICGQNQPWSPESRKWFNLFTEKYNCVVLTDHLSNISGKYCLNPYRLLKNWSNDQFKKNLMPDICIYVGGKRTLNDPLSAKMRSISRRIQFWHVTDDGMIADMYYKLTHIFECMPEQFFRFFAEAAGEIHNDGEYCEQWKVNAATIPPVDFSKIRFTSFYTMGKIAVNLPQNSMLHLGVGNTFINIENFPIDESITVYCNMGTNGIDGSASSFIGQCIAGEQRGFLVIGDLSFFYDMNSIWNKKLNGNVRIILQNDSGAGLLAHYQSPSITQEHNAVAEGWVKTCGFKYMCARDAEEFDAQLDDFLNGESEKPVFFEVFTLRSN